MRTLASGRLAGRLICIWWIAVMAVWSGQQSWAAGPTRTLVSDTVYRADGTTAQGTLLISWPAFATVNGEVVAAGSMSVQLGANGAVSVALIPNTGSTPKTSYRVTLKLDDGTTSEEYWTVPAAQTVGIAAIRSTIAPAAVAQQYVGRDYVDTKLAQINTTSTDPNAIHKSGDEAVAGVKQFQAPPQVPAPQGSNDAAPKSYVDAALGSAAQINQANAFAQPQTFLSGATTKSLNGTIYADQVAGATVGAKIDTACGMLSGTAGTVVVPATMGAGASIVGVPENCHIVDQRQANAPDFYTPATFDNFHTGWVFNKRFQSTSGSFLGFQTGMFSSESVGPGKNNDGGPKDNIATLGVQQIDRRRGQHTVVQIPHMANADGDNIALDGVQWVAGGSVDGGGEGSWAIDMVNATTTGLFSGTVSSVNSNTLTFSSASNLQSLAEDRYLIITPAAYNTGTIASTNYPTTPWQLTGSGTS